MTKLDEGLGRPLHMAARMADIEPFFVMDVLARARELERTGRSVIHMEVGEPDFEPPRPVLEAATQAIARGNLPYTVALGLPELREAIAEHYETRYGASVPASQIAVTAGSSAALLLTMGVLVNPGDEVLMADPGYPCNRQFVRVMGGEPVRVPVGPETAYQLTAELVDAHVGPKTVAVLVASPANPTGTLLPKADLARIAEVGRRRGIALIVDEIYQGLTYGSDADTALSLGEDVFVVNSFSKYFDMTGFRVGWLVAPTAYMRAIEKLAQNLFICAPTPAQHAALAAFSPETRAILEERRAELGKRRDFLVPALRELGFDVPITPEGAFYVYANCERFTADSFAFAFELLEQASVATTPGKDFGSHKAEKHLRFAYTTSLTNLEEATRRLRRFLAQ